jgi:TolA-binding protein
VQHSAGEATLRAGDEWGCKPDAVETAKNEPSVASAPAAVATPRTARRASRVQAAREDRVSGTLAEETALLQTALAAERKGQRTQATTAIMRLLSRYPDSPLVPEARTVLDRVSHSTAP